jgi:hypothetical protein
MIKASGIFIISLILCNMFSGRDIHAANGDQSKKRTSIEVNYENNSPQPSFKQNTYGIEVEHFMGTLADIGFTSNIAYSNYNTKISGNEYFTENLHAFNYSLLAQGEKVFFYGEAVYNSDKLFERAKDVEYTVIPAYRVYQSGHHMFYIGALYVSEKMYLGFIDGWNFLPIVSYMYMSQNLQVMLGIENMLHWQITPYFSYDLKFDFEKTGETSLNLHLAEIITFSALGRANKDDFKLADRINDDEALEKKGYDAGLKLKLDHGPCSLWGYAGYSFQNEYYLADDKEDTKRMKRELDNGWIFRAGIKGKF